MKKIVIVEHSKKNRSVAEEYAQALFKEEIEEETTRIEHFEFDPFISVDYPLQLAECCGRDGGLVVASIFELIWLQDPRGSAKRYYPADATQL